MRNSFILMLGALLFWPADASACHRRSCYGGCYGGWNTRCSGCHGGRYYSGCTGGNHYGYNTYNHCAGGYYQNQNTIPSQPPAPGARSSNYYDSTPNRSRSVRLEVVVNDPSAKITIQGVTTSASGTVRRFESPMLDEGKHYTYTVSITRNGAPTDTRQVNVLPGDRVVVDFTTPAVNSRMIPSPMDEQKHSTDGSNERPLKENDVPK
jgi:uncharacterized protein (TIGR03000 family)